MKLQELKDWIEGLPKEFLEFQIVHAEIVDLGGDEEGNEDEHEYTVRVDKPITALSVDEDSREILLMNEFDGTIDDFDFDEDPHDSKEFGERE